jgi:hypothetical protein
MLRPLLARLPAGVIRWFGRLQFQIPALGPAIGWFGRNALADEGVIQHGVGAGLSFDARGGAPGFLYGTSEPHEQAALARVLRPGDVFYDIGANVGFSPRSRPASSVRAGAFTRSSRTPPARRGWRRTRR